MLRMTIEGIQEAQEANARAMAAVSPNGALGRAVRWGTAAAHRYAVAITHVDTGALKASHRMAFSEARTWARGTINIDPGSINPRGQYPREYGPIEHGRGGGHAFYERTLEEKGQEIATEMGRMVTGAAR